ncbi:bardet-Biedl syndrome 7 protein homolog [Trichonephila clavata]|uniref:Bardet-Biedl syndrome 7 protein homolog n=1 Tax=Trichonephila clavata TaxID=2740835 RepID=A0A8X6IBS9_TRICU|nr:bardet-Biedl syndrome 7 protein homolog [Trichonephila clavata]
MDRKKLKMKKKKKGPLKVHDIDQMTKKEMKYYISKLKHELEQVQLECNFEIGYRKKLHSFLIQDQSQYLKSKEIHTAKDFELLRVTQETNQRFRESRQKLALKDLESREPKILKNFTDYLHVFHDNLLNKPQRRINFDREKVDEERLLSKIASMDLVASHLLDSYKEWSDDIIFEHILKFRDAMQSFNAIRQRILNSIWDTNLGGREPVSVEIEKMQYYFNERHLDNLKTLQVWQRKVDFFQAKLEKVTIDLNKTLNLNSESKTNQNQLRIPNPGQKKIRSKFLSNRSEDSEIDELNVENFELREKFKKLKEEKEKLRDKFILNMRKIYQIAEFKAYVAEEILRIEFSNFNWFSFSKEYFVSFKMMEINLNRVDYLQVGVTSPKTTKLLPAQEEKGCQRVAVADHYGVVQCFGTKKNEIQTFFKTLPGSKIMRLELGGAIGTAKDKIFVASGGEVKGYTRKGKQFLRFDTNMTEPIKSMHISGNDLFVCGNFIFNHYYECQDQNYYLSVDSINDMICLDMDKVGTIVPILACQDRILRVLKESNCLYEIEIAGPPSTLALYQNDGGDTGEDLLYGTTDGKVGLVSVGRAACTHRWEIPNNKKHGGILSIDNYDITGDGIKDLIIGRSDGLIEVYGYDEAENPVPRFTYNCGESVTSVNGGVVGSAGYDELLITTYTGWIFGLSSEPADKRLDPNYLLISEDAAQKIYKLSLILNKGKEWGIFLYKRVSVGILNNKAN